MVEENLKLVHFVLNKYFKKYYKNYDDMFQEGCIALIYAEKYFNADLNVKFSTYAVCLIIKRLHYYCRKERRHNYFEANNLEFDVKECSHLDMLEMQNLKVALKQLSNKKKKLLHLRYYKGLTLDQISKIQNCSKQNISSTLIRTTKKLKSKVF